jgi:hypothetical protein
MDFKILLGTIIRHGATLVGGWLVTKGYLGPDDAAGWVDAVSGALVLTAIGAWSYLRTKKLAS